MFYIIYVLRVYALRTVLRYALFYVFYVNQLGLPCIAGTLRNK